MARKLEFDVELALHKAMKLFWKKGYEATSMQDLVDELGINRFSIYNSFGDKKSLFLQSLVHYRNTVFSFLIQPLVSSERAKKRLDDYFSLISKQLQSNAGKLGCMVQNTGLSYVSLEKEVIQILKAMLGDLREALIKTIDEAKKDGDISVEASSAVLADHILCQIQGLIILRKTLVDTGMEQPQMNLLRQQVANW